MFGMAFYRFFRPKRVVVQEHWYVPLLDFHISTQDFYRAVEQELAERKVPDLEISRVEFAEGGVLSAKREYLRLRRERLVFDICSAPFGTSWFFSCRGSFIPRNLTIWHIGIVLIGMISLFLLYWTTFGLIIGTAAIIASVLAVAVFLHFASRWQGLDDALMQLPIVGVIYEAFFRPETYYREDTRLMYLDTVPRIVKHQMELFTGGAGVKLLDMKQVSSFLPANRTEATTISTSPR
jgi:hypothetical protein